MTCDISPDFYSISEPVAKKQHRCCECNAPILVGEKHFVCAGKWEGHIDTFRQHYACMEACMIIRDHIEYECISFGGLREWVGEYHSDLRSAKSKEHVKRLRSLLAQIKRRERKWQHEQKAR